MQKNLILALVIFLVTVTAGCMKLSLQPVTVNLPQYSIDYLDEVKPILDKRCVVCHSCYNSPCQLKLSSYEGLDRGGSKEPVYDSRRLRNMDPTRLFTDALNTEGWRKKKFFSVTESATMGSENDSILLQLLSHKMKNPASTGEYKPEEEDLTCANSNSELATYLNKHPNRGMPFGFPPLKKEEFSLIAGWLAQGAHGPSEDQQKRMEKVAPADSELLQRWEEFLNTDDAKHAMTARYLYEHLFLAHIRFSGATSDYYEIIRSTKPSPEPIQIIPSRRPYDYPGEDFYYRFRKITSTIVHKTHMVFTLDDKVLARVEKLFIKPEWLEEPHVMGYEEKESADPFFTFQQIPPRSRYQFLLDNAHYIIMTFIRGPVCKGQVALNVINDHFWVFFLDPEADLAVRYPAFLKLHGEKLRMPAELGSDVRLLKKIGNNYHDLAMQYHKVRQDFYMAHYFSGMGYDAIWKGNRKSDAPLLTVFRHFDSASVHRGALGDLPRTVWVMDFPLMERIYYSLVAGFDVYGNILHQLTTRLYMDALRREGESNFLDFLPQAKREGLMKEWYQGMDFFHVRYHATDMPAGITYATADPKREFVENVVEKQFPEEMGYHLDTVNYTSGKGYPQIPVNLSDTSTITDFLQALHSVSAPGESFFSKVTDHMANVALIRVKVAGGDDHVISAVVHRWHDNVTFLFGEKNTFNSKKDSADFFPGFIGSYPNYFFVVNADEMREFVTLLQHYTGSEEDIALLDKFGVNRSDENFWDVYDWFQKRFLESDPIRAGLFDLNRYYYKAY